MDVWSGRRLEKRWSKEVQKRLVGRKTPYTLTCSSRPDLYIIQSIKPYMFLNFHSSLESFSPLNFVVNWKRNAETIIAIPLLRHKRTTRWRELPTFP